LDYESALEHDFGGESIKYVAIAPKDAERGNYGPDDTGWYCYGLSEVRFGLDGTVDNDYTTSDTSGVAPLNTGYVLGDVQLSTGGGIDGGNCMLFGSEKGSVEDWDANNIPTGGGDLWSINMYVCVASEPNDFTNLGGFGDDINCGVAEGRFIFKDNGSICFWGCEADVDSGVALDVGKWQMLTATYDANVLRLYKNGTLIASEAVGLSDSAAKVKVASTTPVHGMENVFEDFAGKIDEFTIWDSALSQAQIDTLADALPSFDGDMDLDNDVDYDDLKLFVAAWLTDDADADFNSDGTVDGEDFALLAASWQQSCDCM